MYSKKYYRNMIPKQLLSLKFSALFTFSKKFKTFNRSLPYNYHKLPYFAYFEQMIKLCDVRF